MYVQNENVCTPRGRDPRISEVGRLSGWSSLSGGEMREVGGGHCIFHTEICPGVFFFLDLSRPPVGPGLRLNA